MLMRAFYFTIFVQKKYTSLRVTRSRILKGLEDLSDCPETKNPQPTFKVGQDLVKYIINPHSKKKTRDTASLDTPHAPQPHFNS